jgi:hypothetical protein
MCSSVKVLYSFDLDHLFDCGFALAKMPTFDLAAFAGKAIFPFALNSVCWLQKAREHEAIKDRSNIGQSIHAHSPNYASMW